MLTKLEIEQLFGRFNYTIELQKTPITILTGPNGYGKSTILRIIAALSNADLVFFCHLPFQKIIITFDDDQRFTIEKSKQQKRLHINNRSATVEEILFYDRYVNSMGERLTRRGRTPKLIDKQGGLRSFLEDDVWIKLIENDSITKKAMSYIEIRNALKQISNKSGTVRLISEQRLIRKERDEEDKTEQIVDAIGTLPNKMMQKISKLTADYSKAANSLDSSYPRRLLSTKVGLRDREEFENKMKVANEKFSKLSNYDLVDLDLLSSVEYQEEFSKALKVYFDDFEEKYKVFAEFIEKLDLYTDIVNSRLTFKKIKVAKDSGLVMVDDQNQVLKLDQLSSGEKQEILLFYELIFETDKQLLLLIDEPEISLHIMWQKMFMNDLSRVVDLGNLRVMVATHSPQIINNRWDIQVDLGELYGC